MPATVYRTAVGYMRVSTQDRADSGVSLKAHRAKVEAYITMHDLDLVHVIQDAGQSAKTLDRPGMSKVLRLIRGRNKEVVVVAKLDRITRSVWDLGDRIDVFKRSGVEFASVADDIDTTTAAGRLVFNVMGSGSQWEREAIGERTAEALTSKRARELVARWGGVRVDEINGRLGTPHDLPGTYIMRVANNGVPLHVASRIARRSEIKITEKFYLQACHEDDDRILAALATGNRGADKGSKRDQMASRVA